MKKYRFLSAISLKFVPMGPMDNNPPLVQIMAWRWICDKPLSKPLLTGFTDKFMWHMGEINFSTITHWRLLIKTLWYRQLENRRGKSFKLAVLLSRPWYHSFYTTRRAQLRASATAIGQVQFIDAWHQNWKFHKRFCRQINIHLGVDLLVSNICLYSYIYTVMKRTKHHSYGRNNATSNWRIERCLFWLWFDADLIFLYSGLFYVLMGNRYHCPSVTLKMNYINPYY